MDIPESLIQTLKKRATYPPADQDEIVAAQGILGTPLPSSLRQLYAQVANGGYGPSYGTLGLQGGARDDLDHTALDVYKLFMQGDPDAEEGDPPWWREGHLPFCYWGCIVYTVVDCRTPEGTIWGFDEGTWIEDGRSLAKWLEDWLGPGVAQPGSTVVVQAGKPRSRLIKRALKRRSPADGGQVEAEHSWASSKRRPPGTVLTHPVGVVTVEPISLATLD